MEENFLFLRNLVKERIPDSLRKNINTPLPDVFGKTYIQTVQFYIKSG